MIANDTIASDKSTASIAKQRFNAGAASRLDYTQAEAELEQERAQLPYYQNMLAQAEFTMDVLIGEQPGAAHMLLGPVAPIPTSSEQLVLNAPAVVIANRPDIREAERKLASATAQQGSAIAKFFPDISVSGFVGLLNTNASNFATAASKSWDMGASAVWPILSYGALSANLDSADAQQQEAMVSYQKSIVVALSDVEKSITAYTQQGTYAAQLKRAVDDDRRVNSIAHERYKEGLTSFIDVLDAERTSYLAESKLTEAEAQKTQDLVAVYKSLGGGWILSKPAK